MDYRVQHDETLDRIKVDSSALKEHQQIKIDLEERRAEMERQASELAAKIDQVSEDLLQQDRAIQDLQTRLGWLSYAQKVYKQLARLQERYPKSLDELTKDEASRVVQELERIESDIPPNVDLDFMQQIHSNIKIELVESCLALAEHQQAANDIDGAIGSLETAKSNCDLSQGGKRRFIRQRLAALEERKDDVRALQYAADEWKAVGNHQRHEGVQGKIARLHEERGELVEALTAHIDRLTPLEVINNEGDIRTCLEHICRLGVRLGNDIHLPGEKRAYEWAVEYYSRRESLDGLSFVTGLIEKRDLADVQDLAVTATESVKKSIELDRQAQREILLDGLKMYFDEGELRNLCFELEIDYEGLSGHSKHDKARELVLYSERHEMFAKLYSTCRELRPNASW